MNLSFAQRLKQADKKSWRTPTHQRSIIEKIPTQEKETSEKQFDFKKHHSDLKMMLKQLEGVKNPEKEKGQTHRHQRQLSTKKQTQTVVKQPSTKQNSNAKVFFSRKPYEKGKKDKTSILIDLEQQYPINFAKTIRSQTKTPKLPDPNKTKPSKDEKIKKKGIPNIGNTCYINSIIQCLFHLPQFNSFFTQNRDEQELNPNHKGIIAKYKSLYESVMSKEKNYQISTLPLKKSVSKICSLFIDFQQEDAHEFLRQLLDSMHQDLNLITEKIPWRLLESNGKDRNIYSLATQYWEYYKNIDDSYIYDSFCGQICNSVTCASCYHQSISFDNFLDLSLPMVKGKNKLQQLIKAYFDPETLCDYYSCSVCHKSIKNSTKKSQVWRAPQHLIIHLKRSQFGRKNNEKVQIPVRCLNMKQYMKYSNDKSSKIAMYGLQGVVLHRGVIDGGHYWSQMKEGSNWFKADDEFVEPIPDLGNSYELEGSEHAYILFYRSLSS